MRLLNIPYLIVCLLILSACAEQSQGKKKPKPVHLVETTVVSRANLPVSRIRTGTLRARREVKIFNQEEGKITQLPYYEGDNVKQGQIVAKLEDSLLQAQYARVLATRKKAEQDLKRTKGLFKRKLASGEELARAETELLVTKADENVLKTRLGYATISAAFTGVISQRLQEPGNVAERYTHLLTISDPNSLMTEVDISGIVLVNLKLGDSAQVRIDALGDKVHHGRVSRIHPNLDPITRQGTIEIELAPVPKGARPGQLCRVQLETQLGNRIMIPFRALRRDRNNDYIFKVSANNKVKRVAVTSGQRLGNRVDILRGVNEGDQIITKGFLNLKSGKTIKVVNSSDSKNNNKNDTAPNQSPIEAKP